MIALVHFGATIPAARNERKERNELINEIVMASYDNLAKGIPGNFL